MGRQKPYIQGAGPPLSQPREQLPAIMNPRKDNASRSMIAPYNDEIHKVYQIHRAYIEHEDNLTNHRTTWLITIQSVVLATFEFCFQAPPELEFPCLYSDISPLFAPMIVLQYPESSMRGEKSGPRRGSCRCSKRGSRRGPQGGPWRGPCTCPQRDRIARISVQHGRVTPCCAGSPKARR
jgi:hypothetical protein